MPEPNTPNLGLIVPNTGDLVGSWGSTALNPDYVALDGILGGSVTIPLTNSPVTLGLPAGTIAPTSGPVQSQNALIKFTGTISSNIVITLGMPGRYVFWNTCLPLTNYVQIVSSGAGTAVGLPPGKKCTVFHDGTNCDYVDMPDVGSAYDLHGATQLPAWMLACTTLPYLVKDGTVYNISAYPTLGHTLGSTFGGDGVNTFGVPDERARARIAYDPGATGRMTSPVNASSMGSNGGEQSHLLVKAEIPIGLQTLNDPGHFHRWSEQTTNLNISGGGGGTAQQPTGAFNASASSVSPTETKTTGINLTDNAGGGSHNNVQPSIVSFLPLIKT